MPAVRAAAAAWAGPGAQRWCCHMESTAPQSLTTNPLHQRWQAGVQTWLFSGGSNLTGTAHLRRAWRVPMSSRPQNSSLHQSSRYPPESHAVSQLLLQPAAGAYWSATNAVVAAHDGRRLLDAGGPGGEVGVPHIPARDGEGKSEQLACNYNMLPVQG